MFLGHYAVGFAAKKASSRPSLGTYFLAASFLDLLWPAFGLLGIEHAAIRPGDTAYTPIAFTDYPYSHSLAGALLWAALFSGAYYALRRDRRAAFILSLAVLSHWVLDAVPHRPDLPVAPGSAARVGLGLWNSVPATVTVELLLFVSGAALYATSTRPRDRTGRVSLWALLLFFLTLEAMNALGKAPPNVDVVYWTGVSGWLFVL